MSVRVIRELVCQKMVRHPLRGTVDCLGMADPVSVVQFPATATVCVVVWVAGVTEETNAFSVTIRNSKEEVLKREEELECELNEESVSEIVFNLANISFEGPETVYEIEIRHQEEVILRKMVRAILEPRLVPATACGDRGTLRF
ncbi:MAG: hypothetical protein VB133_16170 [Anaeromusa sp.]|uniref:DUF6941 family protein n=1 Tax=Anaeromusa sp. TaxID=1872520 RepID=UPI002B1FE378|nr:hypothetical protein [Anaeromusa sp.]MEA4836643.1 hypothetical protein [Anaeromusa sp.]